MKYRLIQMVDDQTVATDGEVDNMEAAFQIRGFTFIGINDNKKNRAELQGMPMFDGLAGPMWDGDAIRYEDWKSYERFSA